MNLEEEATARLCRRPGSLLDAAGAVEGFK